jgi:hypothetical protein
MGFLVSVIEQPRLYLASTDWRPRVARERQAFTSAVAQRTPLAIPTPPIATPYPPGIA